MAGHILLTCFHSQEMGELWDEETLHFHIAVRINGNCITSLILKKVGPDEPDADIVHHTVTFWEWRGFSWSAQGLACDQ